MPGKERNPQGSFSILENNLRMKRLVESFGSEKWQYSHFWVDRNEEFLMVMESPNGKKHIEYRNHGTGPKGSSVEVDYWEGNSLCFSFRQEVGRGSRGKIENHIVFGPFNEKYYHPEWGWGIHYWPDGTMGPIKNIKGMPRKIDMEKTVNTFIEQVINGKFNRPLLILPKK